MSETSNHLLTYVTVCREGHGEELWVQVRDLRVTQALASDSIRIPFIRQVNLHILRIVLGDMVPLVIHNI